MTDQEITSLAREYAEEMIKGKPSEELPNCLKNSMLAMNTEYIAEVFQWLLRRYCLVEKRKVEDIHKGILVQLDPKNFGYSPYNQGRMDVLKSLFPGIAKEVDK